MTEGPSPDSHKRVTIAILESGLTVHAVHRLTGYSEYHLRELARKGKPVKVKGQVMMAEKPTDREWRFYPQEDNSCVG